jgi:hypothetical protein
MLVDQGEQNKQLHPYLCVLHCVVHTWCACMQIAADVMPRHDDTGEYVLMIAASKDNTLDMALYDFKRLEKVVLGLTAKTYPTAEPQKMLSHLRK